MTAFQKSPATQKFVGIQILRFVAAMLVVVMHSMQAIYIHMTGKGAATYWATGLSSVDIFFVISGFVMGISISRWSTNIYARSQAA